MSICHLCGGGGLCPICDGSGQVGPVATVTLTALEGLVIQDEHESWMYDLARGVVPPDLQTLAQGYMMASDTRTSSEGT